MDFYTNKKMIPDQTAWGSPEQHRTAIVFGHKKRSHWLLPGLF
jgi:hypothetical protein